MRIEIKGVQFVNKGAELMLHAVLQQISVRWPKAQVVLAPGANATYVNRAKTGAMQKVLLRKRGLDLNGISKFIPKRLRDYLVRSYGLVFECDIDVVFDAMGFAYGDAWEPINSKLTAGEVSRAQSRGAKYVFLPQALGPFSRPAHAKSMTKAFNKATLVCARDSQSYKHAERLNVPKNALMQFPDFTNLLTGKVPESFDRCYQGQKVVLIIPNHNMLNARNSAQSVWQENYQRLLTNVADIAIKKGMLPVILNHEGKADQSVCEDMQAKIERSLGFKVDILRYTNPLEVKGVIGASHLVVCSRFHGCVSALSQQVPCLGTSWSHKYEALFLDYGRSDYLLTPDASFAQLEALFEGVIATVNEAQYVAAISKQKTLAQAMWNEVEKRVS